MRISDWSSDVCSSDLAVVKDSCDPRGTPKQDVYTRAPHVTRPKQRAGGGGNPRSRHWGHPTLHLRPCREVHFEMDQGNTAFILIAAALVLLMTPGLAFFYGGLVKAKSVIRDRKSTRLNSSH